MTEPREQFLSTTPATLHTDHTEFHDDIEVSLKALHIKVDNLTQGLSAVYAGLTNLITMLQAVQQAASMMPGAGKFMRKFMDQQGGNQNG